MKVNLSGSETIDVPPQTLWDAVIDPATLQKAVPGCRDMRAVGAADYIMTLDLKVAAVGGSFEGKIALSDMSPPHSCTINLSWRRLIRHRHWHRQGDDRRCWRR
jgi:carbon monoxide dehydrogenase subunit G